MNAQRDGYGFNNCTSKRLRFYQDNRPAWKYHFDCGLVDYQFEYQEMLKAVTNFRVPIRYKDLEEHVHG